MAWPRSILAGNPSPHLVERAARVRPVFEELIGNLEIADEAAVRDALDTHPELVLRCAVRITNLLRPAGS